MNHLHLSLGVRLSGWGSLLDNCIFFLCHIQTKIIQPSKTNTTKTMRNNYLIIAIIHILLIQISSFTIHRQEAIGIEGGKVLQTNSVKLGSSIPGKHQQHWQLYNFLDDYKSELERGDTNTSNDMPLEPSVQSEIHKVRFSTTAGDFTIRLDRALSPSGVTRFLELVDDGFFNGQYIYRVEPGFVIQFGVAADPSMQSRWDPQAGAPVAPIPDEPNLQPFQAGSVSFAGNGVNSRSCHVFIALEPGGSMLGNAPHETVLGNVEDEDGGMLVLDQLVRNRQDCDLGNLLDIQATLTREGNAALDAYSGIDQIVNCGRY